MVTTVAVNKPKCVLIVCDDPALRGFTRNSLIAEERYVFDCKVADMSVMIRSVQIDVVVVIGDRTTGLIEQVRQAYAGARVPARRIALVSTAADARLVALEALAA